MASVYGRRTGDTVSWFSKDTSQSNQYCLYCGILVGAGSTVPFDKEHLIGRNFVPTGTLANSFNFIFRSCRRCNSEKAALERHVSSITLVNSPGRALDEQVNAAAKRKGAHDFHPDKKGVPIGEAIDNHSVEFKHGSTSMEFGMVSPPQVNPVAVQQLSFNYVQALFALVTTEDCRLPEKMRLLPQAHFRYFRHYIYQDWGNPQLLEVAKRVASWTCCANISVADGYFKAILRRDAQLGWFWALEWNRYLRVTGAITLPDQRAQIFDSLPELSWKLLPDGSGRRYRMEIPLTGEDHLFAAEVVDNCET